MKLLNSMFYIQDKTENGCSVTFNSNHPIYQAHFPGKPVTPGVCIIKLIGELLEADLGQKIELSEVKNLKFIHPVSPVEEDCVDVRFERIWQEAGTVRTKGLITRDDKVYTKFSFLFRKQ